MSVYRFVKKEEIAIPSRFRSFYRMFSEFLKYNKEDRELVEEIIGPVSPQSVFSAMRTGKFDEAMKRFDERYGPWFRKGVPIYYVDGPPFDIKKGEIKEEEVHVIHMSLPDALRDFLKISEL